MKAKEKKWKAGGRWWTKSQVFAQAKADVAKIRRKSSKARALDDAITRHISKSDRAPMNFNEAYRRAHETADGIRGAVKEKAKKSKFGAGIWFLVLLIIVPILVVGFLILTRRVELPQEGQINDEDFKP